MALLLCHEGIVCVFKEDYSITYMSFVETSLFNGIVVWVCKEDYNITQMNFLETESYQVFVRWHCY